MKKIISLLFTALFSFCVFAQTNSTVDLDNDVYNFLTMAETKGYCGQLSNLKPYTESYIIKKLNQIRDIIEEIDNQRTKVSELETVDFYLTYFQHKNGVDFNKMSYRTELDDKLFYASFEFNNTTEGFFSGGLYGDSSKNSGGYEFFHNFNFLGDLGKALSYRCTGYIGITKMPLEQVGDDYNIGLWWYDDEEWIANKGSSANAIPTLNELLAKRGRTINTYRNNSVLPYSYKKKWDGSVYYLTNVSSNGLEGWPFDSALAFGMYGEVHGSWFNDRLNIGISRISREWAGMDYGSSLVLNSNASPFFAIDLDINVVKHLNFSTMTGVLEFPNSNYINNNAWYILNQDDPIADDGTYNETDECFEVVDSYFFQNLYSIGMLSLDYKYLHLDFGSTCIWPKRFELGYMFPLIDKVVYQNSVGDYDNLSLFGDIKGILPGWGNVWASLYLDEVNKLSVKAFTKTRVMFAYQAGTKVNLPFLPFTTVSLRYTKVEPYCYTHQAIRKQPWYDGYISEAYMNNGRSLGYYLDPNSDELFLRIETKPMKAASFGLQYQLIRHGADYGSGQVAGSSLWSELPTGNRNVYYKYFLHDGTYEWTNSITLDASYNFNNFKVPFQLFGGIGYVYSFFTQSSGGANTNTPYHKINTSEYPVKNGVVMYLGFKAFAFDHCQ